MNEEVLDIPEVDLEDLKIGELYFDRFMSNYCMLIEEENGPFREAYKFYDLRRHRIYLVSGISIRYDFSKI